MFDLAIVDVKTLNQTNLGKVTAKQFGDFVTTFQHSYALTENEYGDTKYLSIRTATFDIDQKAFLIYVDKLN